MRKKRKVRRVMGWLLSRQLNDPGAGACCALSMLLWCWSLETRDVLVGVKISFTWLSQGRVGDRRSGS
jgi:hypothetical protein